MFAILCLINSDAEMKCKYENILFFNQLSMRIFCISECAGVIFYLF